MSENKSHDSWTERLPRIPLDRWLPQKYNSRTTVIVVTILAGTMLLLHTSGTVRSPAALSDHYNRISSAAYSHFRNVFKAGDEGAIETPSSHRAAQDAIEPLSNVYCSPECPCACRPWRSSRDFDPPEPTISNCGHMADRRGRHQNVLAYTYFGTNVTAYLSGIKENAMRAFRFYPGWTMRVYHNGKDNFPAWNKTACEVVCQWVNFLTRLVLDGRAWITSVSAFQVPLMS